MKASRDWRVVAHGVGVCVVRLPQDASEQLALEEDEGRKGRLGKKMQKKSKAKPVALSWDRKVDIARGELEEVKKDAVDTEQNSVRMIDTLKVGETCHPPPELLGRLHCHSLLCACWWCELGRPCWSKRTCGSRK